MENGKWKSNPKLKFEEFLISQRLSEKSKNVYRSVFLKFIEFLNKNKISIISANERILLLWLENLVVSKKTQRRYLELMARVFSEMINDGEVDENYPFLIIEKQKKLDKKKKKTNLDVDENGVKGKRLPVALNEKEFNKFMAVVNKPEQLSRRRIAALLLAGCGLRENELCTLLAKDVHLDVEFPYLRVIGKGNKEREVPIPEEICSELERYEATLPNLDGPFIGIEKKDGLSPYSTSGVYRMINGMMMEAEIVKQRLSPHVLRHTWATRQLQAGVPLATVSLWMGHDHITTTEIYQHAVIARSGHARPKL